MNGVSNYAIASSVREAARFLDVEESLAAAVLPPDGSSIRKLDPEFVPSDEWKEAVVALFGSLSGAISELISEYEEGRESAEWVVERDIEPWVVAYNSVRFSPGGWETRIALLISNGIRSRNLVTSSGRPCSGSPYGAQEVWWMLDAVRASRRARRLERSGATVVVASSAWIEGLRDRCSDALESGNVRVEDISGGLEKAMSDDPSAHILLVEDSVVPGDPSDPSLAELGRRFRRRFFHGVVDVVYCGPKDDEWSAYLGAVAACNFGTFSEIASGDVAGAVGEWIRAGRQGLLEATRMREPGRRCADPRGISTGASL